MQPRLTAVAAATLAVALGLGGCGASSPALSPDTPVAELVQPTLATRPSDALLATAATSLELTGELIDAHDVRDLVTWDGAVLVATAGGVLVYRDGALDERWTTREGLLDNAVRAIYADEYGSVWMAFDGGGCQQRVEGLFEPCGAPEVRITDFTQTDMGVVLALTWSGQVLASPGHDDTADPALPQSAPARAHQLVRCAGDTWVGSRGAGLARLGEGGWQDVGGLRIVESLACSADGLYVAGPEGVFRWHQEALQAIPLSGPRRHANLVVPVGSAWVAGMADGSLWWLGDASPQLVDLPAPVIAAVEAADGLWLGGPGGLFRLVGGPDGSLETVTLPGPGSTDVSAIASHLGTADQLALGLFRHGVARWGEAGWIRLDTASGLPSDEVNGLTFDAAGNLWIATSQGIARADQAGRVTAVLAPPDLPCAHANTVIYLPSSNRVAAATSCGVGWIDAGSAAVVAWEDTDAGLPHRMAYTLTEWRGLLVAGTNDGLAVRDATDPARPWTAYRTGETALGDNWITAVLALSNGELAIGTYSGGFYQGPEPAALHRIEGPRYVNPGALAELGGSLWIGGLSEGAYRLDGPTIQELPVGACLPGPDVTGFAAWSGGVLVASRSGVARLGEPCLGLRPRY